MQENETNLTGVWCRHPRPKLSNGGCIESWPGKMSLDILAHTFLAENSRAVVGENTVEGDAGPGGAGYTASGGAALKTASPGVLR